jgi:hypothetical protein
LRFIFRFLSLMRDHTTPLRTRDSCRRELASPARAYCSVRLT